MKKNIFTIFICLTVGLLLLTGCAPAFNPFRLDQNVQAAKWPADPDLPGEVFKKSVLDFSMNLFCYSLPATENVLLSPASVYLALAMTANGAATETKAAIKRALFAQSLTDDDLNTSCRDWLAILNQKSDDTTLSFANSIWVRDSFPVSKDFLQTNADYFNTDAFSLPQSAKPVNDWVNARTNGKIDKLVEEIDDSVLMYLINALYFKADWQDPFAAKDTSKRIFQSKRGAQTVPFMYKSAYISTLAGADYEGIYLPYSDGHFAFFAIQPTGVRDIRSLLLDEGDTFLKNVLSERNEEMIALFLPKFTIENTANLRDQLESLGMSLAFGEEADFSRMAKNQGKGLFISDVIQKTYCKIDEQGSEAAAVTAFALAGSGAISQNREIIFDHPFFFGIIDDRTGLPLFLGILDEPLAE